MLFVFRFSVVVAYERGSSALFAGSKSFGYILPGVLHGSDRCPGFAGQCPFENDCHAILCRLNRNISSG
jgi:hypothetical protein